MEHEAKIIEELANEIFKEYPLSIHAASTNHPKIQQNNVNHDNLKFAYENCETAINSSDDIKKLMENDSGYYFLEQNEVSNIRILEKNHIHQPAISGYDPQIIRNDFPILNQKVNGNQLIWLDNAATTQKPNQVIDSISNYYRTINSNIHRGAHELATKATDAYESSRETIQKFIGASSPEEIIFARGTTEAINLIAYAYGKKILQTGDEIILAEFEHHADIVPWQLVAKETGAKIVPVPINSTGELMLEEYERLIGPKTKIVGISQVSNALGSIAPVKEVIEIAHRYDAVALVDAAQSVAHQPVNVQDLDADFLVFSGHKIYGPTGIGAVYGKKHLLELMLPWQGGGNMISDVRFEETKYNEVPAKFEAGTPNVADAIGLEAALNYLSAIGLENISTYEHYLTDYAMNEMSKIPSLKLIGTSRNKISVLSFVMPGIDPMAVGKYLDSNGIAVRVGHHCAQPALRHFGLEQTIRPSLAMYNTKEEVDKLVSALKRFIVR